MTFQLYTSGVITGNKCGTRIDHAVTAVGYGTDPTAGEYALVKNSWGSGWGDQGYCKIAIESNSGPLTINKYVSYPTM